jgi:hypothetical protein
MQGRPGENLFMKSWTFMVRSWTFTYVHEQFMLGSSNFLSTVHERVFMNCSTTLFMIHSWILDEWPISSWTFCSLTEEFMNVHEKFILVTSWTYYSWKFHILLFMKLTRSVHGCHWMNSCSWIIHEHSWGTNNSWKFHENCPCTFHEILMNFLNW